MRRLGSGDKVNDQLSMNNDQWRTSLLLYRGSIPDIHRGKYLEPVLSFVMFSSSDVFKIAKISGFLVVLACQT